MNVDNQRDRSVAENRGAGDTGDATHYVGERFDDDLLLALERIDDEPHLAALQSDDDDHHLLRIALAAKTKKFGDAHERDDLPAQRDYLVAVHRANVFHLDPLRLDDRIQRNRVEFIGYADEQRLNDRKRQRKRDRETRALTGHRIDVEDAFETRDVPLDDIHADTASAHVRNNVGGGESRRKDQLDDLAVAQA